MESCVKCEKSQKDLSVRKDVVFKSVLRAMRKYFIELLQQKFGYVKQAKGNVYNGYQDECRAIIQNLFPIDDPTVDNEMRDQLVLYLDTMMSLKRKNADKSKDIASFLKVFKSYSQSKLHMVFSLKPVELLYQKFKEFSQTLPIEELFQTHFKSSSSSNQNEQKKVVYVEAL